MKITGPGSGVPPEAVGGTGGAEGAPSGSAAVEGRGGEFAEKVAGAADPRAAGAGEVASPGLVADIGRDLQAGRITPEVALEKVIDRVLDRQVGANAPAAVRERVGAALRQTLEDDPLLAEKIRTLVTPR